MQGNYRGHLSNLGETLILKNRQGQVIAETAYEGNPSPVEKYLAISEIMYHPADDRPDSEFLELVNLSAEGTLDLTGLVFTRGIDFAFPDGFMLQPGAAALLVEDEAAFVAVYGAGLPVVGEFGGGTRLANGGETLKLEDAGLNTVIELRFDDEEAEGWPVAADGEGRSLELIDVSARPDYEVVGIWRVSAREGGSPGLVDGAVPSQPSEDFADRDGDGVVALLEDAFGTRDDDPAEGAGAVRVWRESDGAIVVEASLGSESLVITLEGSSDLASWEPVGEAFEPVAEPGTRRWRAADPAVSTGFQAVRLRVER